MRKKGLKRLICLTLVLTLVLCIAGCGMITQMTVDTNNKIHGILKLYFTEEEKAQLSIGDGSYYVDNKVVTDKDFTTEVVDGVTYYVLVSEEDTTPEEIDDYEFDSTHLYMKTENTTSGSEEFTDMIAFYTLVFTFPSEITSTNGVLSDDKLSVTFDYKCVMSEPVLFAYTDAYMNSVPAKIEGYVGGEHINYVKAKSKKVIITSVSEIKEITNNDKKVKFEAEEVQGCDYRYKTTVNLKEGKSTIRVTNVGGTQVFSFVLDKTVPTIKVNRSSKYVVFKVKDTNLNYVTLNGKKISLTKAKNGYKITKAGTYTIKASDKAGNIKTTKVKLKVRK